VIASTQPASQQIEPALMEPAMEGAAKLPPFSPVLNKLLATLADENSSFLEIANLIEKDAVLSGNVLRLVNSALYGRRGTVNSVRHAVSLMGINKVRNAAMGLSVSRMWNKLDIHPAWVPAQFNLHGVACALIADQLAPEIEMDYPEGAFAAGLLQHVGLILIAIALQEQYGELVSRIKADQNAALGELEIQILGFSHGELSSRLLQRWNLPGPIIDGVRLADSATEAPAGSLAHLLRLANRVTAQRGICVQPWMPPAGGDPAEALEQAGLGGKSEAILTAWDAELEGIRSFFL
jgi:HD-like signal output (HDOD) protein